MTRCKLCGIEFQPNANPRRLDAYYCPVCLSFAQRWKKAARENPQIRYALLREIGPAEVERMNYFLDPADIPGGVLRAEDV